MQTVTSHAKLENMSRFLAHGPDGVVVEVGVFEGGSLRYLATRYPNRQFFGYDTFSGMPMESEFDNHHKRGDFMTDLQAVQQNLAGLSNVTLVQGIYPESDSIRPKSIALAHIDVDLYESTLNALEDVRKRMLPGGRIYCDDAFQRTCHGATMAMCDFCSRHRLILLLDEETHACVQF